MNKLADRYIYPYAQGVKLDIRKGDINVYRKYPARLYGSEEEARKQARADRDLILQESGIPSVMDSHRHIRKRRGAQEHFRGKPLPVGMSVQKVRGKAMYFVVRIDDNNKRRFSIPELGEDQAYQAAKEELTRIKSETA